MFRSYPRCLRSEGLARDWIPFRGLRTFRFALRDLRPLARSRSLVDPAPRLAPKGACSAIAGGERRVGHLAHLAVVQGLAKSRPDVASSRWCGRTRRTGRGSRGLQGLARRDGCPPFRTLLPLTAGHESVQPKPLATPSRCSRLTLRWSRRCRDRALQPARRDASRGGKTRSKSWFVGLRHRPPRPWDTHASWSSRDLRPVRGPPFSWGIARPS